METLSHSESRPMYSWWWDSHISPRNSKWLQENITDMDGKVKVMIKLIEEDADSFARRAEMYYKKRPELMKLVEEFYRAYRALAERYNHAMGELHHAHRTIAKAFPDHMPMELVEDSPSRSWTAGRALRTPEMKLPIRTLFKGDDDAQGLSGSDLLKVTPQGDDSEGKPRYRSLMPFQDMFGGDKETVMKSVEGRIHDELVQVTSENEDLKDKIIQETERAGKAEVELQGLKKALSDMQAEKEDVLQQHRQCLFKLHNSEVELDKARENSSRAEIEFQTLKEALIQFEADKDAGEAKYREYLEKISDLEAALSRLEEDNDGLNMQATKAEIEAQILKDEISRLKRENDSMLHEYNQCHQKVSVLQNVISAMENEVMLLKSRAESAENEVSELKKSLADLNVEKDASELQYQRCLETISKLEKELSSAKNNVKRLNNDVLLGNLKLKNAEEKSNLLEMSNQSLRAEADNLSRKIAMKDTELSEKQEELNHLQTSLQDEHLHHSQVEETLHNLQNAQSRSQDDQRSLVQELQKVLQILNDMEVTKHGLEEEIQQVRDENQSLSQMNQCSALSVENKENEILTLREIKERLEKEVEHHVDLSNSLQQEILSLKAEIEGLNGSYRAILDQIEAAGLKPECLDASVKILQDENSKLREMYEQGRGEKAALSKKLGNIEDENSKLRENALEILEGSQEKMKLLEESSQLLNGEKTALITEKACLLSQLQAMTENMHNLLEKNAVLENSLSSAKVELEGLREKTKGLEGICDFLKNERSYLLSERGTLALKLESVERRLEDLETKYMGLEEKYADLVKEKKTVHYQVKELEVSLSVEKQERTNSEIHSQSRLAGLESQVHFLKDENRWKKKEYEEEFDRSLKAQLEMSVLQKIVKEMEEKNTSLITECQKHVEASKLAEKLISELEGESLEQQVEAEILLDEIERLRLSIYQVFKALEDGADCSSQNKIEHGQSFLHHILGSIDEMKNSILKCEDDQQLLLVENAVLLTLLEQLEDKGMEIESRNKYLNHEFERIADKLAVANNGKEKLLELNSKLESDVNADHQRSSILEAELENLRQENANLRKKFYELEEEKWRMNQLTDAALLESLAIGNESEVFRSFGEEKLAELNLLLVDLSRQREANGCLKRDVSSLTEKLEMHKAENLLLRDKMKVIEEFNVQMEKDIGSGMENTLQAEGKLFVARLKLEAAENLNLKLCKTTDELKTEIRESLSIRENLEQNILHLSEKSSTQAKEIDSLHAVNANLESEVSLLREEIEEKLLREQTLCSELENKSNEFELWEAEATTFFFGLQITSIREVFFENKVEELSGQCLALRDENASKTSEIDRMKGRICSMENEIDRLNSQLHAYTPVVTALKDDIAFLEHNALLRTKIKATRNEEPEIASPNRDTPEIVVQDQSLVSLQNLQMRIKAVGKSMQEMNKPVLHRRAYSVSKQEATVGELERLKPLRCLGRDKKLSETPKLQKIRTKSSEPRNAALMKDIPLDQVSDGSQNGARKRSSNARVDDKMLELWQTAPDGNRDLTIGESVRRSFNMTEKDIVFDQFDNAKHKSDPPSTDSDVEKELGVDKLEVLSRSTSRSREVNARRILERLFSEAQKLENLQITVQDLRRKLDTNKKGSRAKNVEFETVEEQLVEAEETVTYLVDLNSQLVKTVEECPSPDEKTSIQLKEAAKKRRRKVMEQARKGSERIGRLQLELQKIQYMLLQLEEEKNRARGKFFRSKTIVLRDFIYNGKKNSGKRKKGPFCGCFKPSSSRNGHSSQ